MYISFISKAISEGLYITNSAFLTLDSFLEISQEKTIIYMKTIRLIITLVFLSTTTLLLNSCGMSESSYNDKIKKAEDALNADSTKLPEKEDIIKLIDMYSDFATKYPESDITPEYLFRAGRYCMSYQLSTKALEFFDNIINKMYHSGTLDIRYGPVCAKKSCWLNNNLNDYVNKGLSVAKIVHPDDAKRNDVKFNDESGSSNYLKYKSLSVKSTPAEIVLSSIHFEVRLSIYPFIIREFKFLVRPSSR